MKINALSSFVFTSILLIGVVVLFSQQSFMSAFSEEVETVIVPAGTIQPLTFNMDKDTKFIGSLSVSGGNNDINFWVANPTGDHVIPKQGISVGKSFEFVANSNGGYTFNFDNSFSLITSKTITLTYKVERPLGGGCPIATAAYGSELAPQVQLLREVRDTAVLNTDSGTTFMSSFNAVYYSFGPTISDLERQNPMFKEIVKITITPMLSTLSILNYAEINSEQEMLGYGIGIILLNLGIYFVIPVFLIIKVRKYLKK